MNHIDSNYGQLRRTRVKEALSQGVPLNKTAGETKNRQNAIHELAGTIPSEFLLGNNIPEISTPYESITCEEIYSEAPETLSNLGGMPRYLTPGPHTAPKSTVSNSNTLARTLVHTDGTYYEHGRRGTTTGSKRGREPTGKSSSQQGPAQKRTKGNRATSTVRSNNGRDAGGGEDEEDEDEDEEDEESDEDDVPLTHSGPKEPQALSCPMPSCKGKNKLWDNWNNLIQHLQNTHIKGFSFCERGCGRRFGLSSQYSRHVFKHKKKCKPLSGPPQRIPPLALDLNHAVGKVKGQNYEKLKQVIADHNYYDLEDPNHNSHYVDPSSHSTSNQNLHQYNPQLIDWVQQIIMLLTEHQRICRAYPQTGLPSSGPVQAGSQLNHSPSSIENQQSSQNPIDSAIPQLNQSAIRRPYVYSTQSPATVPYTLGFQHGSGSSILGDYPPHHRFTPQSGQGAQDGDFVRLGAGDYYQMMGSGRASQYPVHTSSFIDDGIPANRGASPSELDYNHLALTSGYHPSPGATRGNGTGDTTRFNGGS